jgi:hypothetical protein
VFNVAATDKEANRAIHPENVEGTGAEPANAAGAVTVSPRSNARTDDQERVLAARAIARWEGEGGLVQDISKRVS